MALNSQHHEAYLEMPLDAQMMPQLEQMQYWARTAHEVMYAQHPMLIVTLSKENRLKQYLEQQQDKLSEEARALEREWKKRNPLSADQTHQEVMTWHNHAKLWAREQLIDELSRSMADLATETASQGQLQ